MRLVILIAVLCSLNAALAGEPREGDDARRVARLLEIYRQDAGEYEMTLQSNGGVRLELHPKPVFIWTNPTRFGGQHGAVFVWTHRGRPEVIGTIFTDSRPEGQYFVHHEFHSLATVPLRAERPAGRLQWAPTGAGLELKPIPGAPPPAESAAARLVQMRALSRQFTAQSLDQRGRWDLRLLPRPLYRYEGTRPDAPDGAVFAFVTTAGTDPEVILVIESRPTDDGFRWHYGLARFSDLKLFVSHDGTQVWNFEQGDQGAAFEADVRDAYRFLRDRTIEAKEIP